MATYTECTIIVNEVCPVYCTGIYCTVLCVDIIMYATRFTLNYIHLHKSISAVFIAHLLFCYNTCGIFKIKKAKTTSICYLTDYLIGPINTLSVK